jgi:hypothetical protein
MEKFTSPFEAGNMPTDTVGFVIPDYTEQIRGINAHTLEAKDYSRTASLSGARKLASSAVAPLVATARGYATITPENAKAQAATLGFAMSTTKGKQIKSAAETGDALLMPWFSLSAVAEAANTEGDVHLTTHQLRPVKPLINAKGEEAKYVQPKGEETIIGLHPATPASWVKSAPQVMIAEGLLKGDSAFTAMLAANGITQTDLMDQQGGNIEAAREKLTELMESIPEEKRVLILGIVGCGTWHGKNDWNALSLRDRDVWIAMDADVAVNRAVWNQAHQMKDFLTSKNAGSIGVLELPPVNGDPKAGVDDFFAAGHTWGELEASIGELPEAPLMTRRSLEIILPTVDLAEAVTYSTRTIERDGIPEVEASDLAEAAVEIDKVVSVRSPLPGVAGNETISGRVTWQVRKRDGSKEIHRARFTEAPMSLLIGARATVPVALASLATGAAAGASAKQGAGQEVLAAWSSSAGDAEAVQAIKTTGLWVDDDNRLGFLTNDGILRPTELGTELRAAPLGAIPKVQIPWIDPVASAKEVTDDWEIVRDWKRVINPAHTGLWETAVGMTMAASVGLQPKGALLLFCGAGSGKTAALGGLSAFYGHEWILTAAISMTDTEAVMRRDISGTNNLIVTVDDARVDDNPEISSSTKSAEQNGTKVTVLTRMAYIPSSMGMASVPAIGGGWMTPPKLAHATRSVIITGEDLAALGLASSTAQRSLSFQTTVDLPLLAGKGEIGPANAHLRKTGAASKLMGAYLVSQLKDAETNGGDDPRGYLLEKMEALQEAEYAALAAIPDSPSLRSNELIAPVLAGLWSLLEVVAEAYTVQGRTEEAEALLASHEGNRLDIVQAWQRHRERYGDDADDTARTYVETLSEALATGGASWNNGAYGGAEGNAIVIGKNNYAPRNSTGAKDDIALLPSQVVLLLNKMGRKVTKVQLRSAFRALVENDKSKARIGSSDPVTVWHITRERWNATLGLDAGADPVEEAEMITRVAAPPPFPSTASTAAPLAVSPEPSDTRDWSF